MECRIIGPLEDAAIFFYKGVIEIAQFCCSRVMKCSG